MKIDERFLGDNHSDAFKAYRDKRFSKYGYSKGKPILYNPEWTPEHSRDKYRWVENVADGLRFVGDADGIIRLNHTGWFIDNFQDETVKGLVYQLPSRDGKPQYVPATSDSCNPGCAILDFHSIAEDKEDAASWADSMAESYAEREREYRAKESAKLRIEEIQAEIKDAYTSFRTLSKELRANCDRLTGLPEVHRLIRAEWKRTKQTIHSLRREAAKLENNY